MTTNKKSGRSDAPHGRSLSELADGVLSAKIDTAEKFHKALPIIFQIEEQIKRYKSWVKLFGEQMKDLTNACAEYAESHKSIIPNGFTETDAGTRFAEIEIDGKPYRLTYLLGDLVRDDGGWKTQDFLAGLPDKWVATKMELDKQAIARMRVTPQELLKHHLVRKTIPAWSIPEKRELPDE